MRLLWRRRVRSGSLAWDGLWQPAASPDGGERRVRKHFENCRAPDEGGIITSPVFIIVQLGVLNWTLHITNT